MRTILGTLALLLGLLALHGLARAGPEADGQALSAEQKELVRSILAKYDPAALTAKDAHEINEAFRAAGLRNGPALQDAIRDAGFEPQRIGELDPPPARPGEEARGRPGDRERPGRSEPQGGTRPRGGRRPGNEPRREAGGGYSIEQAISDRAQLNTIAFDGLAFLTGELGCNTFLPPGKVADFCGFQHMRDVDRNELGHNTSFVPRAANAVLYILTQEQRAQLVALAQEQERPLTEFAYARFPLVKAFHRQLVGDVPAAGVGLDRDAVKAYTGTLFERDGRLSYRRAEVLGGIVRSLTDAQRAQFAQLAFDDSSTWPERESPIDRSAMSRTAHVAVTTYASELLSWYAGGVESDAYFCPERHATYFGSFYMKDIPAMGNPGYSISTSLTGDSGEAFLAALTEQQRALVTGLVDRQRADLQEIVKVRRAIATALRRFMASEQVDEAEVLALARRYGELDGEISWFYAQAFAEVSRTLTPDQRATLTRLRNLGPQFTCRGAYLYSAPIDMPEIPNTDFLFATAARAPAPPPAGGAAPAPGEASGSTVPASPAADGAVFRLRSPEVEDGGALPVDFTGDGAGATLPLEWSGAPAGTQAFAMILHHVAPGRVKWYWVLHGIPASTTHLPRNVHGVGTVGSNSVNGRPEYAPPHSKGPGAKTYVYTVYALSAPLELPAEPTQVGRPELLAAMQGKVLGTAELKVVYTRDVPEPDAGDRPDR